MCGICLYGVFLARSHAHRAWFLLRLLLLRRHRLLMRMLLSLPRTHLSLLMRLWFVLRSSRFWPMRRLFRLIVMLCLLTLDGLMLMLVLRLFLLPVFCLSLPLNLWASLPSSGCGHVFASAISPLVTPYTCAWFPRSMLFSKVSPLLMIPFFFEIHY